MLSPKLLSMPWDMVVFFSITAVGFGLAVKKVHWTPARTIDFETATTTEGAIANEVPTGDDSVLDLGCVETKMSRERVTSRVGQIRVRGRFCSLSNKAMKTFGGVRVKNLSTGKEGTIYLRGTESIFVTDQLDLAVGRNEIQVEWKRLPDSPPRSLIAEVFEK